MLSGPWCRSSLCCWSFIYSTRGTLIVRRASPNCDASIWLSRKQNPQLFIENHLESRFSSRFTMNTMWLPESSMRLQNWIGHETASRFRSSMIQTTTRLGLSMPESNTGRPEEFKSPHNGAQTERDTRLVHWHMDSSASGEFIAIFDADFSASVIFLNGVMPHFTHNNIGMVQTRWGHLNAEQKPPNLPQRHLYSMAILCLNTPHGIGVAVSSISMERLESGAANVLMMQGAGSTTPSLKILTSLPSLS